jgi:nucleoside phosphorylase/DNA-binding NarL/FixJ family response regulator
MKNEHRLSILVVEDDPGKKRKLFDFLQQRADLFEEPDVCVSTADASKRMQEREYDLLILDVVVPAKPGGAPNERNSLDLLEQIDAEHSDIKVPKFILPISSVSELSQEVKEFFLGRPWGVVSYHEDSAQTLLDIESVARWISRQLVQNPQERRCDVFVIAALEDPEFAATEAVFGSFGPLEPLDSKQLVRFCEVVVGQKVIKIAAAFCSRMGPVAAALLTSKAAERLRPRLVVMVGICAGTSDKVEIGDVIAADVSWDWQSGKYVDQDGAEVFMISPHQLDIDMETRTALLQFKRDSNFWASFAKDSRELSLSLPKLVLGPVATGASVLANSRVVQRIREDQNRSVVGLDMETYGVYAAAQAASIPIRAISLKAVCDKGDKDKNDKYQAYAARVSAAAVHRFIVNFATPLL